MNPRQQKLVLVLVDLLAINGAWTAYFLFRVRSGLIGVVVEPDFWQPMVIVYLFWLLVFWIVGLYRPWYAASRLDELTLVFKAAVFGCLFLFFAIFVDDAGQSAGISSRVLILLYGAVLFGFVGGGRLILRSIQRRMLIAGIGVQNSVIVGSLARSRELYQEVLKFPALGYRVIGFVRLEHQKHVLDEKGVPILGSVDDLPRIVDQNQIRDVLVALDSKDHSRLLGIIAKCSRHHVGLKIVPDLYDIISGQARTNQIHGFPLIEISPQLMPPWEEAAKRLLDVAVASLVLFLALPLWLLIAAAIRLETPGPALYKQERVGKDGVRFNILKFRSMKRDAEKTGPQWAHKKDPRVTRVGRILRKLHLDEVPQMINVLKGQMSLVGPRPERPVFVDKLTGEIPMYPRRLKVRPGVTGWAQVKHKYDETIDDVRRKVEYDFYYIENMSLRMDFKILVSTLTHMFLWRGR
jgi:exopolysaccharide biosynthesis polyprenyl glycosylphosphotransferase